MASPLKLELVPYSDELLRAYLDLLPEQTDAVAAGKIVWKLQDNPAGAGAAVLARDEAGSVVGMNVFQAARFRLADGTCVSGHQSMDTIVSPAARGQGLFTRMLETYYPRTDARLIYGFPNANSAPGFFGKLGWTRLGSAPMLIKPLRTGALLRRLRLPPVDLPVPAFRRTRQTSARFDRFDDRHERQWRSVAFSSLLAVDRTAEFWNWRFAAHPEYRYERRETADGSFVVLNRQERHGARLLYVAEAIGARASSTDLLREATADARRDGCDFAFAWSLPTSDVYSAYRAAGFLPFPDRLRPIELHFGARALGRGPTTIADPKKWFVSYADSDTV